MKIFKNNSTNNFEHEKKFPRTKKTDFLYKILLASKANEQGSGLVFAFAVGFLLLILGTASIVTSGQNNTNAVVNEKANQVQAITDAGKKRFESFIATNPQYAEYGKTKKEIDDLWADVSDDKNTNNNTIASYETQSEIDMTCSEILKDNKVDTKNPTPSDPNLKNILGKQAINDSNFQQGGFQVTDYKLYENANETGQISFATIPEYETEIKKLKDGGTTGSPFAYAVVEIQGTVNPNATDTNSIFTGNNLSKNKLKITIPLIKRDPNEIPFPGLWIGGPQVDVSKTNQKIDANTMINISDCTKLQLDISYDKTNPNSFLISEEAFPTLPDQPTVHKPDNGVYTEYSVTEKVKGKDTTVNYDYTNYVLGQNDIELPRTGDKDEDGVENGTGIYNYSVGSIDTSGNTTITINKKKKVHIHVNGNIDLGGNSGINFDCNAPCDVTNFRIYGHANPGTLSLNGGPNSKGFIFAPNYSLGVAGGGKPTEVNFQGLIWIKEITPNSKSNKIIIEQSDNIDVESLSGFYDPYIPAKIGNPTSIERIEAN